LARSIAGPVLVRFPGLKKQVQRTLSFQATSVRATPVQNAPDLKRPGERRPNPIFTVPQALASLERSLRALQTDHVDLWLLHEVRPEDLASDPANDPLLRLMEDVVQQGKVGAFGVGSDSREVPSLVATRPAYCGVTQFDWSVLDPALPETASFRIHHRALTERFTSLAAWLKSHEELCRQWSHEVGADLSNAATLAQLMLKASLVFNPRSVVLFSSKRRQNMLTNAATVEDSALEAPARALHSLLQQERPALS
jgi:diketogulonate reductase-like aldo/keto reductase